MGLVTAKVKNTSRQVIGRGGITFPPDKVVEVNTTSVAYAEITAHQDLEIQSVSNEGEIADNANVLPDGLDNSQVTNDHDKAEEGFHLGAATQGGGSTSEPVKGDSDQSEKSDESKNAPLSKKSGDDGKSHGDEDQKGPSKPDQGTQDVKAKDTYKESKENPKSDGVKSGFADGTASAKNNSGKGGGK